MSTFKTDPNLLDQIYKYQKQKEADLEADQEEDIDDEETQQESYMQVSDETTSQPRSILTGRSVVFNEEASAPPVRADAQNAGSGEEQYIKIELYGETHTISKEAIDKALEQYAKMGIEFVLLDFNIWDWEKVGSERYPASSVSAEQIKAWMEGNPRKVIGTETGKGIYAFVTGSDSGFEDWLKSKGIEIQDTALAEIGSLKYYYFTCDTPLPSMMSLYPAFSSYPILLFFGEGKYVPLPPSFVYKVGIQKCWFIRDFKYIQPIPPKMLEILKEHVAQAELKRPKDLVPSLKSLLKTGCHSTVSQHRGMFLPYKKIENTKFYKEFVKQGRKFSFENSYIKVEIARHPLTQIHANILDVMMTKLGPKIDENGNLYVETTLYELQKHLGLKKKNDTEFINKFIKQMIEATIQIYRKKPKVSYGLFHIIESIKRDDNSGKLRIVFNKDFINSYFKDTLLNYRVLVDDILCFKYAPNQSIARFLLSQKRLKIGIDTLFQTIGIDVSLISRRERNKLIKNIFKEKDLFEKLGITITSGKQGKTLLKYVKHEKVYFNDKLNALKSKTERARTNSRLSGNQ